MGVKRKNSDSHDWLMPAMFERNNSHDWLGSGAGSKYVKVESATEYSFDDVVADIEVINIADIEMIDSVKSFMKNNGASTPLQRIKEEKDETNDMGLSLQENLVGSDSEITANSNFVCQFCDQKIVGLQHFLVFDNASLTPISCGTFSEEVTLPTGENLETIDEVSNNRGIVSAVTNTPTFTSYFPMQHTIPKKDLMDAQSSLRSNQAPRTVIESAITDLKSLKHETDIVTKSELQTSTAPYSFPSAPYSLPSASYSFPSAPYSFPSAPYSFPSAPYSFPSAPYSLPSAPYSLPSAPYSLPSAPYSLPTASYYLPSAAYSLQKAPYSLPTAPHFLPTTPYPSSIKNRKPVKVKKPKSKGSPTTLPFNYGNTRSLGALGQQMHGLPRDSKNQAVQICPLCKFQAATKNPYRHLQDHLALVHFKERIAKELPAVKPFKCPVAECNGKHYPDWQAVMRHYIGNKHGILQKFVKEMLEHEGSVQSMSESERD